MNFLEALKKFISKGNDPDKIIFYVVYQLLDEFISFKKYKNPYIPDIRFDELITITYEKLIKEGFKSVAINSTDDDDAKKRIRYLIYQYYNTQYSDANPRIEQLNKDVKYLLNQFSSFFPQVGKATRTEHKIITISSDFNDISDFNNYKFAKNEPKKTRFKNVFFAMYEILHEKKSSSYFELVNHLKSKLDIAEQIITPQKTENNFEEVETDEIIPDDIDVLLSFKDDKNEIVSSQLENGNFEDSNTICETYEIDQAINHFLHLCTERQKIIFGRYILTKNGKVNDRNNSKYSNDKFKELTKILGIGRQTLYNENSKAIENLSFVMKKYELNENEKTILIKTLVSEFKKYFNEDSEDVS